MARSFGPCHLTDRRSPNGQWRPAVEACAGSGDPRTTARAGSGDPRTTAPHVCYACKTNSSRRTPSMPPVATTSSLPAKSILPATWKLPDEIVARLGETAGRQRPMLAGGHLLLVLHEPPGPDDTHRVGRFFWRDIDGSWKSNNLGPGIQALRKH